MTNMSKKRAMSSEKASQVKLKGHQDAREFAEVLGIGKEFKSEPQAKKDVIDVNGYSYSVKSGEKKWQIFLYGKTRFEKDYTFKGMNGLGKLFLDCINIFPEQRSEYLRNKKKFKLKLQKVMIALKEKLSNKYLLQAFLDKALFNSGEVDFLVIKQDEKFHVFYSKDVVNLLSNSLNVMNSMARNRNQLDFQKVVFKVRDKTFGEIEMRNDSDIHYREIKFWLDKNLIFNLLNKEITKKKEINPKLILYGKSISKLMKRFSS